MIKLPKSVMNVLNKIEESGYSAYVVGGCVRDFIMGLKPFDWDICTNAPLCVLKECFEEGKVLNEELEVIRLDFRESSDDIKNPIVDITRYRQEKAWDEKGRPTEFSFVDSIEIELARRDFTINAIADNPSKKIIDIYGGRDDIKRKQIVTIGSADDRLKQDPNRIFRAFCIVAEKNFDLSEDLYTGISDNVKLISQISKEKITKYFKRIIEGKFAGKAIELMCETGVIEYITGGIAYKFFGKRKVMFNKLIRNIENTYPIAIRRLSLFYDLLSHKDAKDAISYLTYTKKEQEKLFSIKSHLVVLGQIRNVIELKRFISEVGYERYEFLDNIAQDKVVVYGGSPRRINKRKELLDNIELKNEAVVKEDLIIDGEIIKNELDIDGRLLGEILNCILLDVHRKPFLNHESRLIEMAKSYKHSRLKRKLRQNKWLQRLN